MADPGSAALTLAETAARCGGYRWMEHRLFEVTGAWAVETAEPAVTVFFDQVSTEHAWHAQLWLERLPVLAGWDHQALTRPPSHAVAGVFEELANGAPAAEGAGNSSGGTGGVARGSGGAGGPESGDGGPRAGSVIRLAGLARVVLPRLSVTYRHHLAACSAVADRPVIRALRLAGRDVTGAWGEAEGLLQERIGSVREAAVAAAAQRRLESLLSASGARVGFGWPAEGDGDGETEPRKGSGTGAAERPS